MLSFFSNQPQWKIPLFSCKEVSVWWYLSFMDLYIAEFCSNYMWSVTSPIYMAYFYFQVSRYLVNVTNLLSGLSTALEALDKADLNTPADQAHCALLWKKSTMKSNGGHLPWNTKTALMSSTSIFDQKQLFWMMLDCLVSLAVGEECRFLQSLLILSCTAPLPPAAAHWNSLSPRQRGPIKNASRCFLTRQCGISIQIQAAWK